MLALTAPLSCRQAAYTSGRREKPFVKLGTWPNNSRSVSYIAAASPVARSSGTASMKLMPASFPSAQSLHHCAKRPPHDPAHGDRSVPRAALRLDPPRDLQRVPVELALPGRDERELALRVEAEDRPALLAE